MPTRTINLKMVLGKKQETDELRRALWTTHTLVNQAVASIERILLLCRGRSYWTLNEKGEEVQIPEHQVVEDTLKMAREAQRRNGKTGVGSDEDILKALRMLYEQVVPSSRLDDKGKPLGGDAQSIGSSYAGPLFDPDTCLIKDGKDKSNCGPFAETASKLFDDIPNWTIQIGKEEYDKANNTHLRFKNAEGNECYYCVDIDEANLWIESESIHRKIAENKHFNKDKWKKQKDKGDDSWAVNFVRKQMELAQDSRIGIRKKLWEQSGLLPIGELFFDKATVGNLWNRLALRLAVAHLLSWESWNHSTLEAHKIAKRSREDLMTEYQGLESNFKALREYEIGRQAELKRVAFFDDDRPFKIGARSIRAWDRLREAWIKSGNTQEAREAICRELQTKLRGKFGDPDLFLWLAKDGREHLWKDTDNLTPLVKLNRAENILRKRKKYALMTFADARLHPRWAMYEAPGGTNLRNYTIAQKDSGLQVSLPLLVRGTNGEYSEKQFCIPLAHSGQFSDLHVEDESESKKKRFRYQSAHQDFEGVAGGAELLFDRPYLEHAECTNEYLFKRPGPAWFKLTLDVQSKAPQHWLDGKGSVSIPPEVIHFSTALSNKSKHAAKLEPGFRVLSVDLGMRIFAACSVFELVQGKPKKGLFFPTADGREISDPEKLWAKHERSFKLTVPGETPTKKEKKARNEAWEEIRSLRRDIGRLRNILRLSAQTEDQRREHLLKIFFDSFTEDFQDSALRNDMFQGLDDAKFKSTPELWQQHCQKFYDQAEKVVAGRFSSWRKTTRPRSVSWDDWRERRNYAGGKSIWMIEYLEAVRNLIMRWNLRGRTYGAVNRQDKKLFGTVASRLLHHINKLKEDRTKSGADLIIQAARGFVPVKDGKGWLKEYEPCRAILFEDLARYRFRVDRPRRENSQLMKWTHRKIFEESAMQAQIYGVTVHATMAGFSSRYLATSGAPGVRCRQLETDDFENGLPKPYVAYELEWMLGRSKGQELTQLQEELKDKIQAGTLVPWPGGELFATLKNKTRELHVVHADLNAAQNLQRRFWGRCGDSFRITCKKTDADSEDTYELEKEPGARLLGALQQLENGGELFHLVRMADGRSKMAGYVMKPLGDKKIRLKAGQDDTVSADVELEDNLEELEVETSDSRETFFRDPSGILISEKYWLPSKEYWSIVRSQVWKAMKYS